MEMIVSKQIGERRYTFVHRGDNLFEVVMEANKLSFPDVYVCGLCKGKNLCLDAYRTENGSYEYVKIKCLGCGGSLTFGKKKSEKDVFFLRRKEDKTWDWQPAQKRAQGSGGPQEQQDDLPF